MHEIPLYEEAAQRNGIVIWNICIIHLSKALYSEISIYQCEILLDLLCKQNQVFTIEFYVMHSCWRGMIKFHIHVCGIIYGLIAIFFSLWFHCNWSYMRQELQWGRCDDCFNNFLLQLSRNFKQLFHCSWKE